MEVEEKRGMLVESYPVKDWFPVAIEMVVDFKKDGLAQEEQHRALLKTIEKIVNKWFREVAKEKYQDYSPQLAQYDRKFDEVLLKDGDVVVRIEILGQLGPIFSLGIDIIQNRKHLADHIIFTFFIPERG